MVGVIELELLEQVFPFKSMFCDGWTGGCSLRKSLLWTDSQVLWWRHSMSVAWGSADLNECLTSFRPHEIAAHKHSKFKRMWSFTLNSLGWFWRTPKKHTLLCSPIFSTETIWSEKICKVRDSESKSAMWGGLVRQWENESALIQVLTIGLEGRAPGSSWGWAGSDGGLEWTGHAGISAGKEKQSIP